MSVDVFGTNHQSERDNPLTLEQAATKAFKP
jgi:hypothetical protein